MRRVIRAATLRVLFSDTRGGAEGSVSRDAWTATGVATGVWTRVGSSSGGSAGKPIKYKTAAAHAADTVAVLQPTGEPLTKLNLCAVRDCTRRLGCAGVCGYRGGVHRTAAVGVSRYTR